MCLAELLKHLLIFDHHMLDKLLGTLLGDYGGLYLVAILLC